MNTPTTNEGAKGTDPLGFARLFDKGISNEEKKGDGHAIKLGLQAAIAHAESEIAKIKRECGINDDDDE